MNDTATIVAYMERSAPDPESGVPGVLRDEWRVRKVTDFGLKVLAAALGPDWRRYQPFANYVLEHRYVRRGVEESWALSSAANDRHAALEYIDSGAVPCDPELVALQARRRACIEAERAKAETARRAEDEHTAREQQRAASEAAFQRLAASSRDGVWAERWNAFVTSADAGVRTRVAANRACYDAVMAAMTVPAKRAAIRAFLATFSPIDADHASGSVVDPRTVGEDDGLPADRAKETSC